MQDELSLFQSWYYGRLHRWLSPSTVCNGTRKWNISGQLGHNWITAGATQREGADWIQLGHHHQLPCRLLSKEKQLCIGSAQLSNIATRKAQRVFPSITISTFLTACLPTHLFLTSHLRKATYLPTYQLPTYWPTYLPTRWLDYTRSASSSSKQKSRPSKMRNRCRMWGETYLRV